MYKKQVGLQKILCLFALIAGVVVFAYALGFATDLYDAFFLAENMNAVAGAEIFYLVQDFNTQLMVAGLGLILLGVLLFITNTHARRRYYISNYIATGAYVVAAVAASVWGHMWIEAYKAYYLTVVDFTALDQWADMMKTLKMTPESTFWFDAHYAAFAVALLAAALLVVNVIWKVSLMKQEAKLLAEGETSQKDIAAAA